MLFSCVTQTIIKTSTQGLNTKLLKQNSRNIFTWLNIIFNQVDHKRIKELGPDRVCAEWLLRNGAAVQWVGSNKYLKNYNCLQRENVACCPHIEKIDATGSSISHYGFLHFVGCKHIREVILEDCGYIQDEALRELKFVKDSLEYLKVCGCANVTDKGLLYLKELSKLKILEISKLPYVKQKDAVLQNLKTGLTGCKIMTDFEK